MSLRLEMLQVARLAPRLLGESAELIRAFVLSQRAGPGFAGRDGQPDLYYTVFGMDCLSALQAELPELAPTAFEEEAGSGDVVKLACLARLQNRREPARAALRDQVLGLRRPDGGFAPDTSAPSSTVYASFLALGALQDLRVEPERAAELAGFVRSAWTPEGGCALAPGLSVATTPTTAAGVVVLHQLGERAPAGSAAWLTARASPRGGFVAAPDTPVPDLLSTAVSLHALSALQAPIEPVRDPCLDFVDTLWTSRGGFFGHWAETELDCEYTFYGLLALGHLAV